MAANSSQKLDEAGDDLDVGDNPVVLHALAQVKEFLVYDAVTERNWTSAEKELQRLLEGVCSRTGINNRPDPVGTACGVVQMCVTTSGQKGRQEMEQDAIDGLKMENSALKNKVDELANELKELKEEMGKMVIASPPTLH